MIYFLYFLLFSAIIWFSLRYNWWRVPQSWDRARILMYHSVEMHFDDKFDKWRVRPQDFEKQMSWLHKNGFTSFTISELCTKISKGETLPKKTVLITFDDGYMDNFTNAFAVLKKYGFKATIYLVANQKTNHWESKNTAHISPMLNEDQIRTMQESNLIEFGSHTLTHSNLINLDDEALKIELENSKIELEKITQKTCTAFAYPYGKFDERVIKAVKNADYKNAVIVKRGLFSKDDDKFSIKRVGILGTESFFDFWLKITRVRNKI